MPLFVLRSVWVVDQFVQNFDFHKALNRVLFLIFDNFDGVFWFGFDIDAFDNLAKSTLAEELNNLVPGSIRWLYYFVLLKSLRQWWLCNIVESRPVLLYVFQHLISSSFIIWNLWKIFTKLLSHLFQSILNFFSFKNFILELKNWFRLFCWVIIIIYFVRNFKSARLLIFEP